MIRHLRACALGMALAGAAIAASPAIAAAQGGYGQESPADALARNVRILASSPSDFAALVGAGQAALDIGDNPSAAGFFGRAEEIAPRSPLPQAGMGAALARLGDPQGALRYFATAVQYGATQASIGAERGLAYDLLGQHSLAQADYRAALAGPESDEARRRLALSLAISGRKSEALTILAPLMARGDAAAARCRSLVLALTGDLPGARAMLDARMPGASAHMAYFFAKLPSLSSPQKAAAVHLGVFPGAGQPAYAAAAEPGGDRLASIESLLRTEPAPAASAPPPVQVASAPVVQRSRLAQPPAPDGQVYDERRVWLQLASGKNAAALPDQFRRIKARGRDLLDGIDGYVAEEGARARLLIGPFKNSAEANIFAENLETERVDAFSWTNPPGQIIRKLSRE